MQGRFFIAATVAACVIMFVAWQQFFGEPMQREILSVQLETHYGDLSTLAAAKGL